MSADGPTNSAGVKLPYFHRTLSEQDKALIGDITPKQIDSSVVEAVDSQGSTGKLSTSSKWNAAMTWEERDCTVWAKDKVAELFVGGIALSSSGFEVEVTSAENIGGHAQIAHVRGKARYLYELNFDLQFHVVGGPDEFNGRLKVMEAANDQLEDLELDIAWDGKSPSGTAFSTVKKLLVGSDMKAAIVGKIKDFEKAIREL
jgi:hypothetical protein